MSLANKISQSLCSCQKPAATGSLTSEKSLILYSGASGLPVFPMMASMIRKTQNLLAYLMKQKKIECYIKEHYNGHVHAVYGCSLRGSLVGQLMSRGVIEIDYGILGSSDLDQAGALKTWILCKIGMPLLFPFIHDGEYKSRLMKKKAQKSMKENGEYGRRFMSMISGPMGKGLPFVTKKSAENQFYLDMTTVCRIIFAQ